MMKRKSLEGNICAVARALDIVGDWWSLLIIRDALHGVSRFSEFQRNLGVAKNILTARLKTLINQEIFTVVPAADGGAHQEYILTKKGEALLPVLVALAQWGSEYLFATKEVCAQPLDATEKQPLEKLQLRAQDGRLLSKKDIILGYIS
jgi:DNA-binding HxlR family transcriptional regulator